MKIFQIMIVVCSLICFFVTFVFSPVAVSANATFVEVAVNYQDAIQVAPYLVPFILILIGLDYYYSNIDEIIDAAEALRAKVSTRVQEWADRAAAQIIDGTSVFKIDKEVVEEVNENSPNGNKIEPGNKIPYIMLGVDLLNLGAQTAETVITYDISGELEDINENIVETNKILDKLGVQFQNTFDLLTQMFEHYQVTFSAIRVNFVNEIRAVEKQLHTARINLLDGIESIRTVEAAQLQILKDDLGMMREISAAQLNQVKTNVNTELNTISNNTGILINSINDLSLKLAPAAGGAGNITGGGAEEAVKNGKVHLGTMFNNSNGILQEYGPGIMAAGIIFSQFADIPFFAKLLITSLSIGSVAIFLGIVLNVASHEPAKSKESYSKSGG